MINDAWYLEVQGNCKIGVGIAILPVRVPISPLLTNSGPPETLKHLDGRGMTVAYATPAKIKMYQEHVLGSIRIVLAIQDVSSRASMNCI